MKGGVGIGLLSKVDDGLASHVHSFGRGLFLVFALSGPEESLDIGGEPEGTPRLSKSFLFWGSELLTGVQADEPMDEREDCVSDKVLCACFPGPGFGVRRELPSIWSSSRCRGCKCNLAFPRRCATPDVSVSPAVRSPRDLWSPFFNESVVCNEALVERSNGGRSGKWLVNFNGLGRGDGGGGGSRGEFIRISGIIVGVFGVGGEAERGETAIAGEAGVVGVDCLDGGGDASCGESLRTSRIMVGASKFGGEAERDETVISGEAGLGGVDSLDGGEVGGSSATISGIAGGDEDGR